VWRWGWIALMAAVFFCPLGQTATCSAAVVGGGQCSASYVPLMGSVFGYSIPAP
jgi:hypothetical protein